MADNGKKQSKELVPTKELNAVLGDTTVEDAFHGADVTNALKMFLTLEGDFDANLLRLDIPDNETAIALASYIRKCKQHGYTEGVTQMLRQCGLIASVHAKRIIATTDAIAGERKNFRESAGGGGLMDKIKNQLGKMYGD